MPTTSDVTDHVNASIGVLRLGARLFAHEVDAPLYHQMLDADITAEGGHPFVEPPGANRSEAEALEDLAAEFCRLFIGPQPECPPYASAYHGEVKLGGRPARAIQDFMARHHAQPVIGEHDAVLEHDHLSVELALLAHFYQAAIETEPSDTAGSAAWAAARELLDTHLWPWADGYLTHVAAVARIGPYSAVSHLLRSDLRDARTWLTHHTVDHLDENPR